MLTLALCTGAGLMATGCGQGPVDDTAGTMSFSPLESRKVTPQVAADRMQVPERQKKQIQMVVDGFKDGADTFFATSDPQGRLSEIEIVFIASGHYLDLVGIYQNVVEKQGISSAAVPPLVRAYLRLGQPHLARVLLDEMLVKRGDEPLTWFLNGAYWLTKAQASPDAAAQVVASWQKALEIDPKFTIPGQQDAPTLREQLAALRQQTPADAVAKAVKELAAQPDQIAPEPTDKPTAKLAPAEHPGAPEQPAPLAVPQPPVDDVPAEHPGAAEQPAPQALPEPPKTQATVVLIARGDIALSQDDADQAESYYKKALKQEPTNANARFGAIRAGWTDDNRRGQMADDLRELAKRDDLSARQAYDIGLFAFSKLDDKNLAVDLWKQAKRRDPALAERVGIDSLIDQASH